MTAQKKSSTPNLPITFLLITLLIVVAGGYVVYNSVMKKNGSTMNPLSKGTELESRESMLPKLTEEDFKDIPDPLIRKHLATQYSQKKFRITSVSNSMGTNSSSIIVTDHSSPTNYRMQMIVTLEGKENQNTITIGDTTYMKDTTDGTWWMQKTEDVKESENPLADTIQEYSPERINNDLIQKTLITYKKLGEEPCGNLTCYHYEEDQDGDSGKRTFWFDTKELLLRKEIHGYGEFNSETMYSYDTIEISAPSPTKPVPAGKSIYEMQTLPETMGG